MLVTSFTAQKTKFSIKDFLSKCDQIRRKLRIWSHLLKKSLMENFIFCSVFSSDLLISITVFYKRKLHFSIQVMLSSFHSALFLYAFTKPWTHLCDNTLHYREKPYEILNLLNFKEVCAAFNTTNR